MVTLPITIAPTSWRSFLVSSNIRACSACLFLSASIRSCSLSSIFTLGYLLDVLCDDSRLFLYHPFLGAAHCFDFTLLIR